MTNKEKIKKLRDMAELAWASYGYFHLANHNYDFEKDGIDKERLAEFRKIKAKELDGDLDESIYPTLSDILNINYKYFKDKNGKPKDSWYHKHFLDGDFTPTQAKNFFERYDLLKHCPNTSSGFSATLFQNKQTKEYILSIRGTESKKVA